MVFLSLQRVRPVVNDGLIGVAPREVFEPSSPSGDEGFCFLVGPATLFPPLTIGPAIMGNQNGCPNTQEGTK